MNECTVLFRSSSSLPQKFNIPGQPIYEGWLSVDSDNVHDVDAKVRALGWHLMWLNQSSSGIGVGLTAEGATSNAMRAGLDNLNSRFNTAELVDVRVRKYPGFHVVQVKLESRHVQECASLGLVDEAAFRYFPDAVAQTC